MAGITTLSEHACFGGVQGFYEHQSASIGSTMRFGVYAPPQASAGPVPVLFFLAGLTCNEETFAIKAGAQQHAARLGLMLVTCDTSPRSTGVEGAATDWEFGEGAGFYLDAIQSPYARHWQMESYVTKDLREVVFANFRADASRASIFGHSMGGHGALTIALRHTQLFRSVSALAPICAPSRVPWGVKAFTGYLGSDPATWASHDAVALIEAGARLAHLLVDQGRADKFLEPQLKPDLLEQACKSAGQPLTMRYHDGYDHGYYFIASVVRDHLEHHRQALG